MIAVRYLYSSLPNTQCSWMAFSSRPNTWSTARPSSGSVGWERVSYFHIELETHDVIFAEGAPSETFIDDNSRGMFHNAHEFALL